MGKPSKRRMQQKIAVLQRRNRVRRDVLGGLQSQGQLAVRYGVSQATISKDIKEILKELREESQYIGPKQVYIAEQRLLDVYSKASNSYELSKKPEEQINTKYVRVKCRSCNGTGFELDDKKEETEKWCEVCQGKGKVIEEVVTRTVKGQAGDSSFLITMLQTIREWNKMHGNYPSKAEQHQHLHLHQGQDQSSVDLSTVSSENLLDAVRVMKRLRDESKTNVIDVTPEE